MFSQKKKSTNISVHLLHKLLEAAIQRSSGEKQSGQSLKKHHTCGCCMPKQCFIVKACD